MNEEIIERPPPTTGLIVLGIFGILLGLILCCAGVMPVAGPALAKLSPEAGDNPMLEAQENDPMIRVVAYVGGAVCLVAGIALIVSSIGLFRFRKWAWKLAVATVGAFLCWTVLSTALDRILLSPRRAPYVEKFLESEEFQSQPELQRKFSRFFMTGGGSIVGVCCCLPLPIIMLVGLLLPGIRGQFFPPEPEAAGPMAPPAEGFS